MKTVINLILAVCAILLCWICVGSIVDDQKLDDQIEARKKVVEARLIDIKKAEEAYKEQHDTTIIYIDEESQETKEATMGCYAETFDVLIDFLKTGRYPRVMKTGQLSEERQRAGWTEAKASKFIYETELKFGRGSAAANAAIEAEKLQGFRIDTTWVGLVEELYGDANYPIDSLRFIPFSGEEEFELQGQVHFKMGIPMNYVMECAAHFRTFLKGMGKAGDNKRINMTNYEEERGAYPGLKIGDIANWNNNAGNWE
ncbi:MAG: hypothetical protein KBT12_02430 [Bacteroidales bacterium]|nr:hypothetical protein [Candidatus Physcousia equi]